MHDEVEINQSRQCVDVFFQRFRQVEVCGGDFKC